MLEAIIMKFVINWRLFLFWWLLLIGMNVDAVAGFDATIPVIDLNDFNAPERHKIFIRDLSNALSKFGFVAVINTNVDKKVLNEAYAAAKEFYAQPTATKMLSHDPKINGQRGYVQSEIAKGQNLKDFKEFYHITREYSSEISQRYGYPANIWPNNARFKVAMQQLLVALEDHIAVVEQALAESIGQPRNYFNNITKEGGLLLRSLHYPAHPPKDIVWAAAHTDIDLFTILPRATADGLQLLNDNGEWMDVIVPDDAFIINAGDMLQNLTNGVYKSAMHRVVSKNPDIERYSIVVFIHPRPSDSISPLPKFVAQVGKRNFANVTAQELLSERLIDLGLNSQELLQNFAASGAIERLLDVDRASVAAMRALQKANLASPRVKAALLQQQ